MRGLIRATLVLLAGTASLDCGHSTAALPANISLPGEQFYPEGIAAAADGRMFIGSVREGNIVAVPRGASAATATPFVAAAAGRLVSVVGLLVDDARGTLWACSSDPGVAVRTGMDAPAVKAFDLATGGLKGSFDLPGGGLCNDLALDSHGNLYATDSFAPRVLRLASGGSALEVWLTRPEWAGDGFNLNGVAVDSADRLYTVKYNSGELFRVEIGADGAPKTFTRLVLPRPLESPDGLKVLGDGKLLLVEGVGRLTELTVTGDAASPRVLAENLNGPTTFTLYAGDAWVVEGQLSRLFTPAEGPPSLPFRVVRVGLK